MDDGLARGAANRRGGSHDSDSVFGRTFFPASGLLADRSRPGANIEARPRFNPRSGRVALIAFFDWTSCLFFFGGSVDDGLARGALQPAFRARYVDCFFSFLFFFFSGQTANHIVGISFYRIFGDCVKNNANFWLCTAELCLLLRKGELIIDRK